MEEEKTMIAENLKKNKSTFKVVALWFSFALLLCLLLTSILSPVLQRSVLNNNGPLGQLYEVNGRQMHLYCTGEGGPTIVLSADILGGTLSWALLQEHLSESVRVCSYDRPGIAWSDVSLEKQSLEDMANDLNDLLMQAGESGPYIFVGHGFGGAIVRSYLAVYQEAVAAIVFLDSQPRDVMQMYLSDDLVKLEKLDKVFYQKYKNSEILAQLGLLNLFPGNRLDYLHLSDYSEDIQGLWRAAMHRTYWETALQEWHLWRESKNNLSNEPLMLGEKPLRILVADYLEEEWPVYENIDMKDLYDKQILAQQELLRLSYDNSMVTLNGIGHDLPRLAPEEITNTILEILGKINTSVDSFNEIAPESDLVEIEI